MFSQIFFSHLLDRPKLQSQCNFDGKISMNSRVIVKIPFLEHQRFYNTWFRMTWHMAHMIWVCTVYFESKFTREVKNIKIFWIRSLIFLNAIFFKMRRQKSIRSPVKSVLSRREVIQNSGNVGKLKINHRCIHTIRRQIWRWFRIWEKRVSKKCVGGFKTF